MTDVSATYTAQADGQRARGQAAAMPGRGQWREAVGKAQFTGAPTTASLKVSFWAVLQQLPRRRAGSGLPLGPGRRGPLRVTPGFWRAKSTSPRRSENAMVARHTR